MSLRPRHFIGYQDANGDVQVHGYYTSAVHAAGDALDKEQAPGRVYSWLNVPDNTPTFEVQQAFASAYGVPVTKIKTTVMEAEPT